MQFCDTNHILSAHQLHVVSGYCIRYYYSRLLFLYFFDYTPCQDKFLKQESSAHGYICNLYAYTTVLIYYLYHRNTQKTSFKDEMAFKIMVMLLIFRHILKATCLKIIVMFKIPVSYFVTQIFGRLFLGLVQCLVLMAVRAEEDDSQRHQSTFKQQFITNHNTFKSI